MNSLDNSFGADSLPQSDSTGNESSANDLSSLLNYPSISRLFDGPDPNALEDMRSKLSRTSQDLERVIRQGSKEDAERAERAVKAIGVTQDFLNTLEQMRREQKKT